MPTRGRWLHHISEALAVLVLGIWTLTAAPAGAAPFTQDLTGTTAAVFLKAPVGPRSVAMGGAYTAVADGPEALWWNPAGLLSNQQPEVLLENSLWLQALMLNTVAYRQPINNDHVLGFMFNYMAFSTPMTGYDNQGRAIGDITYADLAFSMGYATNVFEIPFGLNAKLISSTLDDANAVAVAGDMGFIQGFLKQDLTVGLGLKNWGTKLQWLEEAFPLPFTVNLGVAYYLLNKDLILAAEVQAPFDQPPHYHFGVELSRHLGLTMQFALRLGYHTDWQEYRDALNGLSAGLGWEWRLYRRVLSQQGRLVGYKHNLLFLIGLDYTWIPNEELDPSHRFGLRIGF